MLREEKIAATGPVARIIDLVESLWEDEDEIEQFFMTPSAELGGRRPLDVARTEQGAIQVENLVWHLAARRPGG
ncbi:MAG TPA: MbcA/ParS/Xre antitoxin family protein [Gammaproteobacteria bacterium]